LRTFGPNPQTEGVLDHIDVIMFQFKPANKSPSRRRSGSTTRLPISKGRAGVVVGSVEGAAAATWPYRSCAPVRRWLVQFHLAQDL